MSGKPPKGKPRDPSEQLTDLRREVNGLLRDVRDERDQLRAATAAARDARKALDDATSNVAQVYVTITEDHQKRTREILGESASLAMNGLSEYMGEIFIDFLHILRESLLCVEAQQVNELIDQLRYKLFRQLGKKGDPRIVMQAANLIASFKSERPTRQQVEHFVEELLDEVGWKE